MPSWRKAKDGVIGGQYRLRETPATDYLQGTEWNVRDTDGTVVFTLGKDALGGSQRTIEFARKHKKPCAHISRTGNYKPGEALQRFVQGHGIARLNVAGSRESKAPGIYLWVCDVIEDAFFWSNRHPGVLGRPVGGNDRNAVVLIRDDPFDEVMVFRAERSGGRRTHNLWLRRPQFYRVAVSLLLFCCTSLVISIPRLVAGCRVEGWRDEV